MTRISIRTIFAVFLISFLTLSPIYSQAQTREDSTSESSLSSLSTLLSNAFYSLGNNINSFLDGYFISPVANLVESSYTLVEVNKTPTTVESPKLKVESNTPTPTQIINNPVTERIIERVITSGITKSEVNALLQ